MSSRKADGSYEEDDGEYMPPNKKRKGMNDEFSEEEDDMYDEQDMDNAYEIDNAPAIEHRHEEEPAPEPLAPVTQVTPISLRKTKKRKKEEEQAAKDQAAAQEKLNKNRYHCNYCRKDITDCVRIKCSVCTDFDLCVECFSVGVEISPHKNFHEYQVMDNMHFPLFDETWGADEEILLLEAIEMYGLGNWNDISDHVGTKNWLDCKTHYFETYINVASTPLPDFSKVLTTQAMVQQLNKKSRDGKVERAGGSGVIPKLNVPPTPSNNELHTALVDSLGYMKNRNEFETEYENDAEFVIRDIIFEDDDEPQDKELKQKVLELYNKKLDERIRLRRFILDNGLLDYKKIQQQDRRRPKEDRELYNNMRVFLQVLPRKEYDELLVGLVKERQLRRRIEVLQNWRKQGVKTIAEGELYEVESQRRTNSQKRMKDAGGYYDKPGARGGTSRRERYIARERDENTLARLDKLKARPRKPGQPLDLEGQPGVELLSPRERQVCSTVRILPKQYMAIKDTLLSEYAKCGHLNKTVARALVKIDVNKTARLFEFFEQSGWINRPGNLPHLDSSLSQQSSTLSYPSSINVGNQQGNLFVSTQPQVVVVQQGFQSVPLTAK